METFHELPKEKQEGILLAAMDIFAQHEYKKANTEDIAHKAGISKGLLFYYFKDKKQLYLSTLQFCIEKVKEVMNPEEYENITDFFALMEYGGRKKLALIKQYPAMVGFVSKAFASQREAVSDDANAQFQNIMESTFDEYFSHVDFSKFREGVEPRQIYRMLVWMSEGYLYQEIQQKQVQVEHIMKEFYTWAAMFRKMAYKEEYQEVSENGFHKYVNTR